MSRPLNLKVNDDDFDKTTLTSPPDRFNSAYFIFVLLGVGGLFPWNAFLTAYDYFVSLYFTFPFPFIMSIVFNVATVTFQFIGVGFGSKISLTIRMIWTFAPFVVTMLIVPFVPRMFVPLECTVLGEQCIDYRIMGVQLLMVFLCGMSTAMGFNCIMGLASQFPPQYIGAVMTGQGVAGIIVGLIRIVTKVAYQDSPTGITTSTLIYFILAAFIEAVCLLSYFVLIRLNFSKFYMKTGPRYAGSNSSMEDTDALLGRSSAAPGMLQASVGVVLRKVLLMGFTVWSVFFVTLSLFPGMTSVIPSQSPTLPFDISWAGWFGVINIFIFQVMDFVGRSLPRFFIIIKPRFLWIFSVARVGFAALFILCIIPKCQPVFDSIWASFIIMGVFAITNGYFGTLAMMFAPDLVEEHEKSLAGMIMSVFLQLGIFSAVLFALGILYFVDVCQMPMFLLSESNVNFCANATNITVQCMKATHDFLML